MASDAALSGAVGSFISASGEAGPMTADPLVHRIEFDIPWPPHTAYAYLIDAEEPVLVDAGSPGEAGEESLRSGLAEAGYDLADVAHVLVTHPHTDHGGQVASLVESADPTVYALDGVHERLARTADDLADVVRDNATEVGTPDVDAQVDRAVDSLQRNRECLPPDAIDVEVTHAEAFDAGGVTFEPVHVPGHQENQAAFLADGRLFAGDTIVEPFRPAALHVGLDRGCYDAVDAFYAGLRALSEVEPRIERVFPGHGPVFEDVASAIARDWKSLDDLVEACRETVVAFDGPTPYEVTEARIDNPRHMEFAIFETVGALARLERHGLVESSLKDGVRRYTT